jgi:hypothetical protein
MEALVMKRTRHTPEQVVSKNTRAEGHEFHHVLCAVTKLRILPYPKVGRTVYFHETDDTKALVPVAYAIYHVD